MKLTILLKLCLLLLFSTKALGLDCNTNKLFCRIIKLQPKIDKDFAKEISDSLYKASKKYNVDPNISLAILMQESSFRNVNTYSTKVVSERYCDTISCKERVIETREALDLSFAQININTAVHYGLDLNRLYNMDIDYTIKAHILILKDKIALCQKMGITDYPWSCYHSITANKRLKYVKDVKRYLK